MTHRQTRSSSRLALTLAVVVRAFRPITVCLLLAVLIGSLGASAPAPTEPGPVAAAPPRSLVRGVVANNPPSFTAAETLNPPVVRVEFAIGTDPASIAPTLDHLAAQGTSALLLAGFYQSMPTEEQSRAVGAWAHAFGPGSGRRHPVTTIEFGNETSYSYQYGDKPGDAAYGARARVYALRASMAAQAVQAGDPEVGLLAQADDGGSESSAWVDSMFAAVPTLDTLVSGWVVHPYGPTYAERLTRTRIQLSKHGASKPLWITEWGVATDGGRCLDDNYGWDPCMDSAEAADLLRTVVGNLAQFDVAAFFIYQLTDHWAPGSGTDKEGYFGVLTSNGRTKGDYTDTVRAFFAADRRVGSGSGR